MKKILLIMLISIMFLGCEDNPTHLKSVDNNIVSIGNNIYIKQIKISDQDWNVDRLYIYVDVNGNPIVGSPITNTQYISQGKTSKTDVHTTLPPMNNSKSKFSITCDTIEECEQKINIIKESIK